MRVIQNIFTYNRILGIIIILIIFITIVVLIPTYVAYYFLYQNYINKRLAGKCKQKRLPQEINITIRERGSKLEERDIIANVSFVLYSINK